MVRGWGRVVRGGSYRGPRPREGLGGSIIRFIPMPHAARFTVSFHSSRGSLAPRALSARLRAATHEQRKRADSIATASGTGPIRGRIAPPNPPPLPRLDPRGGGRGRGGLRANLEKKCYKQTAAIKAGLVPAKHIVQASCVPGAPSDLVAVCYILIRDVRPER